MTLPPTRRDVQNHYLSVSSDHPQRMADCHMGLNKLPAVQLHQTLTLHTHRVAEPQCRCPPARSCIAQVIVLHAGRWWAARQSGSPGAGPQPTGTQRLWQLSHPPHSARQAPMGATATSARWQQPTVASQLAIMASLTRTLHMLTCGRAPVLRGRNLIQSV